MYGHAFDALNRLTQETDPNLYTTVTAFDAQDAPVSVTDARSLVTTYVRDGFGDAIRRTSPDTGITDFGYDANGAVTRQVDARGVQTDFTNDALGRVLTKSFPATPAENVTCTYDATAGGNKGVGRLTGVADQSGSTSDTRVIAGNSYTAAYTYAAAGNVLTMTYPSGRIVTYARDALGRISGITTQQNGGAPVVTVASGAAYKPFGPPAGLSFVELARTAMARWPSLKVVLTSGFPESRVNGERDSTAGLRLLSKPYRRDDLARTLREILDRGQSDPE